MPAKPSTIVSRVACPDCGAAIGKWCRHPGGKSKRDATGEWLCLGRKIPRGGKRDGAGRPATIGAEVQVNVRLPPDLRDRLAAYVEARDGETTSAVIRRGIEREIG